MMQTKLEEIHRLLGDDHGIKDSEIGETLWYYYFDVQETVSWLLGSSVVVSSIHSARQILRLATACWQ